MNTNDREQELRNAIGKVVGKHYMDAKARRILDSPKLDWSQYWPEVDAQGVITGGLVGDEDGFYNVDDLAMVAKNELPATMLTDIREQENSGTFDGYVDLKDIKNYK
jgi:hypothetical protein